MHYGLFDFTTNGQQTIIPKKQIPAGVRVGQRNGLSKSDIEELRRLFQCQGVYLFLLFSFNMIGGLYSPKLVDSIRRSC